MALKDDDKVRFWSKVSPEPNTGCWLWAAGSSGISTGSCRGKRVEGYGSFAVARKNYRANRVAWELTHGPIPEGMCVLHRCDNPACVNAHDHLYLGDMKQNMADKYRRGRAAHPVGERHYKAKVTADVVMEMRRRRAAGETARELSGWSGLSVSAVIDICAGNNWSHLPFSKPPDGRKTPRRSLTTAPR